MYSSAMLSLLLIFLGYLPALLLLIYFLTFMFRSYHSALFAIPMLCVMVSNCCFVCSFCRPILSYVWKRLLVINADRLWPLGDPSMGGPPPPHSPKVAAGRGCTEHVLVQIVSFKSLSFISSFAWKWTNSFQLQGDFAPLTQPCALPSSTSSSSSSSSSSSYFIFESTVTDNCQ